MRLGQFELVMVGEDRKRLPQIESGGKSYTMAAPGQRCSVMFTAQMPPNTYYKVYLRDNGRRVGYSKIFRPGTASRTSYFDGFLQQGDAQSSSYHTFVFAEPGADESKSLRSLESAEGQLVCEVWKVYPKVGQNPTVDSRAMPAATVGAPPDGKKVYLAPSCTTPTGGIKHGSGFDFTEYEQVGSAPVARLEMRYATAAMMMQRDILDPANPEHRNIINTFVGTLREQVRHHDQQQQIEPRLAEWLPLSPQFQQRLQQQIQQQLQQQPRNEALLSGRRPPSPLPPQPSQPPPPSQQQQQQNEAWVASVIGWLPPSPPSSPH